MIKGGRPKVQAVREVPAVKRAVAVLFHLARKQQPASLSQIARELDIIPSSCLHILRELMSSGLVVSDAGTKTYGLGPAVLALAIQYNRNNRFVDVARPYLEEVARTFHVDVSAHESDGLGNLTVVTTTDASLDVEVRVPLGHRFPLLSGASGRCIAAFNHFSEADLKEQFQKVRWQGPISFARWREQVEKTRETGVGVDDGYYRKGLTTIAAPVLPGTGPVTRFIGALCISDQLTTTSRRQLTEALKKAASRIASDLHGPLVAAA
jgi:DNA-binding IclR family transcriptional regulator